MDLNAMTSDELTNLIDKAQKIVNNRLHTERQKQWEERRAKSDARQKKIHLQEKVALELFKQVEPGDFVRIVGMRNSKWNYRRVDKINSSWYTGTFTGMQARLTKYGTFVIGDHSTTTGGTKVREVIKKDIAKLA